MSENDAKLEFEKLIINLEKEAPRKAALKREVLPNSKQ